MINNSNLTINTLLCYFKKKKNYNDIEQKNNVTYVINSVTKQLNGAKV